MAQAETVVAVRTIPAQTVITAEDLRIQDTAVPGAVQDPMLLIGQETRVALFPGRPVRPQDVGAPAVVERNQIIVLHYETSGLSISTEGRALGRAGPGDIIRVMNLSSRNTVTARISEDGSGYVAR